MSRTTPIVDSRDCGPVAESWHPETSTDSCQWESTERHHLRSCRRQSTVEKSQPAAQNNPLTSHRLSHWLGMFLQGRACRTENFRHVYKFEWHAFTSTQRPRLQTWWEQSLMANWHEDLKNQSKQITSQMTPTIPGKTHTGNFERRNKSHNVLNVITNAFQSTAFSLKYSWKYIC